MRNNYSRRRRDLWHSQPPSRPVSRPNWATTPMARPMNPNGWSGGIPTGETLSSGGSSWTTSSPMVRPVQTAQRQRYYPRRPGRMGLDTPILMGIAFFILLCASLGVITKMVAAGTKRDNTPAPAQQQKVSVVAEEPAAPAKQTKILLIGTDQRPKDGSFRTDVLILLSLDTNTNTVSAVSFPRDLWVKVPSLYEMKINEVYQLGGWDAMAEMFQANFGVRPEYYVMTNFNGLVDLVNSRGGIEVEVGSELTDDCDLPQQVNGDCTVEPGTVFMDGDTALWYVRSRHTSSDIDRLRRAQEVIYALGKKLINISSLPRFTEIRGELGENVKTNLDIEEAFKFLPLAIDVMNAPDEKISRYAINENQATEMISWNGQWILLPDEEAVKGLIQEAGIEFDK